MTNSLTTAAQNASPYSAPPVKGCNFCGKDGLLILPLITAAVPAMASPTGPSVTAVERAMASAPALPATACAHIKSITIKESSYTLRMARSGYLYMLVNRKDSLSWQCYISTAQGYWSQFAADAPPLEAPEFTCEPSTHGINASMVAIVEAKDVQTAYLLFTPSPLTVAMLSDKELKNVTKAEAMCAKGQMVKFSPKSWVAGGYTQTDCLQAMDLKTSVAEFALADIANTNIYKLRGSPLYKALANAAFPLMATGQDDTSPQLTLSHLSRLSELTSNIRDKKAVAVAMYDPIGIAQSLNDFRNDGLNKVDDFLKTADDGTVTNKWKFDSLQALRQITTGFEKRVVGDTVSRDPESELHIRGRHEPMFPDDPDELSKYKNFPGKIGENYPAGRAAWQKQFPAKHAALEAELAKFRAESPQRIAKAQAGAKAYWAKKYAPLLDDKAMGTFDTSFDVASKAATDLAAKRVDDHLAWMLHDRFVDAFDVFDRADICEEVNKQLNTHSGTHFANQSALCTIGMVGCEKSAAQVDAWLAGTIGDKKNIYMRGLMLNQTAIENESKTSLAEAGRIAAAAGTVATIPNEKFYKTLKSLADLFKKADGAWDEFLRNQGQAKAGFGKSLEGAALFKLSEWSRSLFRKGITTLEMQQVGKHAGFILARMGGLAEKLVVQELLQAIDPQSPHPNTPLDPNAKKPARNPANIPTTTTDVPNRPNVNPERAAATGKQVAQQVDPALKKVMTDAQYQHQQRVQGVTYTVEEYLKDAKTNNYHQARIGVLLGAMETIALGVKTWEMIHSGKASKLQIIEAVGNVMSIASIGLDVCYAISKSVREVAEDTAIRGSGDIVRGGFKGWAGAFGAVAGGLGVWADVIKVTEEGAYVNRTGQKAIIWARIFVGFMNTGLSGAAAFSYSGPMLRRLEINLATSALKRRAAIGAAATLAEWLALRVLLLRAVAWFSGAGMVLTGAELAYYGYLSYQPSELQTWCKRCAFRNASTATTPYSSAEIEMADLSKARALTNM
jgi:hypothetical protein